MDLDSIVAELKKERDRIDRAIASLLRETGNGVVASKKAKPSTNTTNGASGYWKDLSPEQRSAEMKRRAKVRAKNWNKGK